MSFILDSDANILVSSDYSDKTKSFEIAKKYISEYSIIYLSLFVLFLAIIIIRIFSNTITNPIEDLVEASNKIERGEFNLDIKPKTKDEIGFLTSSFIQMSRGLSEREKLMVTFSKFTNKTIAQKAVDGQLALGGENRNATIFFSDIRSFTAMSEKMTPAEVVDFLNQYMTLMVECVNKTNGVVDKYIGDAIMAVRGAPESSGNPAQDALNAVITALMMRESLSKFNKERNIKGLPPVRIGCGINTGPVVAGQIGSDERMEYTVIGDAVNLASRTEDKSKTIAEFISDGSSVLLNENSIIQIFKDKKKSSIDFINGDIQFRNNSSDSEFIIYTGTKEISIRKKSEIKITIINHPVENTPVEASVEVIEGEVEISEIKNSVNQKSGK